MCSKLCYTVVNVSHKLGSETPSIPKQRVNDLTREMQNP